MTKEAEMSCYLRHLKDKFPEFGIDETDKKQKKAFDLAIRAALGIPEAHCPEVWKALKPVMNDEKLWARVRMQLKK